MHLQPLTKRFRGGFQHIPREAIMLKDQYEQHLQSIRNVIVGCCECFQRKRVAYQSQLRRVRDNSNMAIRNVMQVKPQHNEYFYFVLKLLWLGIKWCKSQVCTQRDGTLHTSKVDFTPLKC